MMLTAKQLIDDFRIMIQEKWGYIYGETHTMWNAERQAAYKRTYDSDPEKYADRKLSAEKGSKWYGHWVTDCSGAFHYWFAQHGESIPHGSNSIWNKACSSKGTLSGGKRTDGNVLKPGTAVLTSKGTLHNHIGLYVGDGEVIEAMGTNAGVTTSKITDKRWTHWGELKGVSYDGAEDDASPETPVEPVKPEKGYAVVTGKRVALRRGPSTDADVITRVDTGNQVKVETPPDGWLYVEYNGKRGYMMKQFLTEG